MPATPLPLRSTTRRPDARAALPAAPAVALLAAFLAAATGAHAQEGTAPPSPAVAAGAAADSPPHTTAERAPSRAGRPDAARARGRQWGRFALGFASSLALHELGHVAASYAVGSRPSFGFDKGRPTIYSGIDEHRDPRKQFIFSSAGLNVQTALDEALLDVPHRGGGAFERGLLAGGLATVAFYVTIGRNAPVSDVTRMAATSSLSRSQVSLIYGGVSALQTLRIVRRGWAGHFYVAPAPDGALRVGIRGGMISEE